MEGDPKCKTTPHCDSKCNFIIFLLLLQMCERNQILENMLYITFM
jgi:hypothetical protein